MTELKSKEILEIGDGEANAIAMEYATPEQKALHKKRAEELMYLY